MATQPTNDNLPAVMVEGESPVRKIDSQALYRLGQEFSKGFEQYASDRKVIEQRWMRNLRQYLGIYDPDVERQLPAGRSRAYPRITRVKCISMLSRIMNLMFPGNERNWEIKASPSAEMSPEDVAMAVQNLQQQRAQEGLQTPMTMEILDAAVQDLANKRAEGLTRLIDDQLQELGGDQTLDHIALNRQVCMSGIRYGLGVLRGPFVRKVQKSGWVMGENGQFQPTTRDIYKPQYEFTPVWDFYPDMTARSLPGEGYYLRMVVGRSELRRMADRPGFFADQVKAAIKEHPEGNYKPQEFENELRAMGVAESVSKQKTDPQNKYEIIAWFGPISARKLEMVGVDVADAKKGDDIEGELWMVGNKVIKADMNPWRRLGVDVRTIHTFVFDEDDTSPVGNGLPNVVRDSQMSVCAATRMTLDNASVTCGPNLEINISLLRADQDLTSIEPYKIWYRDDDDPATAQAQAVRKVEIDGHLAELQGLIAMFSQFADMETFIGPATGGDMSQAPSEPMRTAAGASMMRGDAALPFKDIIRNYDTFTQSVIQALVHFNRKFNPALAPEGDYNVIARGATSLIAKEVRAIQMDQLAQTMAEDDIDHLDRRKFMRARLAARDLEDMMVPESQAAINREKRQQSSAEQAALMTRRMEAEIKEILANAFKDIAQAKKNSAGADATAATTALEIMAAGAEEDTGGESKS